MTLRPDVPNPAEPTGDPTPARADANASQTSRGTVPLRIVVVTNLWPSPRRPAWGSFVAHRVESLRRLGHEVQVVPIQDHPSGTRRYASLAAATLRMALRRSRSGTVVEAHIAYPTGLLAAPLARRLRAPLVLFAHGSDVLRLPDRGAREQALARRIFGRARLVIANTNYLAGQVSDRLGVPSARIAVAPPGIRYDDFRVARAARSQADRDGVCFVANLIPRKGLDLLLLAMVELRDRGRQPPPLRVVGDGPERDRLAQQARAAELPVTFVGACAAAEVPREMSAATTVVVPSREEALGLAALEGMAAGCVTVAAGVGGLAEVVRDGVNGVLAASASPTALADALERAEAVVADEDRRPAMLRAADQTAREHAVDAGVARTIAHYAELLALPARSGPRGIR